MISRVKRSKRKREILILNDSIMKKKVAAVGVPIAVLLTVIGGSTLDLDFDFSNTNIGQIGDNIINNYLEEQGIDLDTFREICELGKVHEEIKQYCDLI